MMGIVNNISVQLSFIMLIGRLAKNAILIVEYAVQRRKAGKTIVAAALEASRLRFRPILMTSLAFIVGMIPLLRASGGSALGNHSIGAGAVGGMLTGVILGVFIIPVLFVVFQFLHEKAFRPKPKKMALAPRAISAVRQAVTVILMAGFAEIGRASCRERVGQ